MTDAAALHGHGGADQGLEHADPLAVPLPHGTEVTTRVDPLAGEREARRGEVGRVVAGRGDEYDVPVVGVGTETKNRRIVVTAEVGKVKDFVDLSGIEPLTS